MICPFCNEETSGIKLNNKSYCSNCGELLNAPVKLIEDLPAKTQEKSFSTSPQAKLVSVDGESGAAIDLLGAELSALDLIREAAEQKEKDAAFETEINELEAEEEILDILTKNNSTGEIKNDTDKEIVKHNRPRIHKNFQGDYLLVKNEPNPIATPELVFPHDDQIASGAIDTEITAPVKKETEGLQENEEVKDFLSEEVHYPFFDDKPKTEINIKNKEHQEVLTRFLKEGASKASRTKKKRKRRKLLLPILITLGALMLLAGLVLFVKLYAPGINFLNNTAEVENEFNYKQPEYMPAGYELTRQQTIDDGIRYSYEYLPDNSKTINIDISATKKTEKDIFTDHVAQNGNSYLEVKNDNGLFWIINDQRIVFVKENLLYVVVASDKISTEELLKVAEGII